MCQGPSCISCAMDFVFSLNVAHLQQRSAEHQSFFPNALTLAQSITQHEAPSTWGILKLSPTRCVLQFLTHHTKGRQPPSLMLCLCSAELIAVQRNVQCLSQHGSTLQPTEHSRWPPEQHKVLTVTDTCNGMDLGMQGALLVETQSSLSMCGVRQFFLQIEQT